MPNASQKQTRRRGLFRFGPHWCDWTELFMSTIEFPLGGQIELTVLGVRVGDLRQLANQYEPGTSGILAKLPSYAGD